MEKDMAEDRPIWHLEVDGSEWHPSGIGLCG